MIHLSDVFFESGVKEKLQAVGQLGELLQALDVHEWQAYSERNLVYLGTFIENTVNEVFEVLEEIGDQQKQEQRELSAKLPPDPEKEAKRRAEENAVAVRMAEIIDQTIPAASEKVRELIQKPEAQTGAAEPPKKDFRQVLAGLADNDEELDPFQMLYEVSNLDSNEYGTLKRLINSIHFMLLQERAKKEKQPEA